ncbi:MAG: sodium/proton-translocating pyrophosphatase [Geminicoccaceae bacterium]
MQEIASAIGRARAYLNRQYMTIAGVGVVIFLLLSVFLGIPVGIGYLIGAVLSGCAGYIRHECIGASQCPHRAGSSGSGLARRA